MAASSNQVRFTSQSPRSVASSNKASAQVEFAPDSKGTGRLKVPTAIALKGKRKDLPAVANPSTI